MRKLREWMNIQLAKNPGKIVLCAILLFNVLFFVISSLVISALSLSGTEKMGFFEAAFCTITMILDAGCIQFVVSDIGTAGVAVVVICLGIVLVGMITFTGAVIGYITNYISNFIDSANAGNNKLRISGHNVILNWNSRASEIINDLLYCDTPQKVVVLAESRRTEIEKEIHERLVDTVRRENNVVRENSKELSWLNRKLYMSRNRFRNRVTVIVREGDVFSFKQLMDISLEKARMIVILNADKSGGVCRMAQKEALEAEGKGNSHTVKTLMQVADITAAQYSEDDQKIIVEITDDWTAQLVDKIIAYKQVEGKCNIVPVQVNQILGHILAQFSLMPELNLAYRELFSNKGAAFYTKECGNEKEEQYIRDYLKNHCNAIPLTAMTHREHNEFYYAAGSEREIGREKSAPALKLPVRLNKNYWIERKNIILLGHNSHCEEIMKGFEAFCCEWNVHGTDEQIVRVLVIDDEAHLKKMDHYQAYPFVVDTVAAEIYEKERICSTIESFAAQNEEDTSILILSDDMVSNEDVDANALANLIYVQGIINEKKKQDPSFDTESIDVIVEIVDPKHHDIVNSYSVNNVVISNRYISKMITQIGEKEALFEFYTDILTYDTEETETYESKEIYIKKVRRFFEECPPRTTADQLIRGVYEASVDPSIPENLRNPSLVLGYVKPGGRMVLFSGDQTQIPVELEMQDKLILFSNH